MCLECGCGKVGEVNIGGRPSSQVASPLLGANATAAGSTGHEHEHGHEHAQASHVVDINQAVLAKNDRLAERNRGYFKAKRLLVLNMVSAPGSGKTTFIEKTARALKSHLRTGVIVGDLAT